MMFLAACQSDALPEENLGGAQQTTARSDSSYINLRIVNSNAAMTRATEAATAAENAVYDGMNGMVGEIFGYLVSALPVFPVLARSVAEVSVQSIVEDKTQRQSALYADVTDDLHPTLYINAAEPQGYEEIEEIPCAVKYIRQGQLLIQKGERIYTPQGQQIAQ